MRNHPSRGMGVVTGTLANQSLAPGQVEQLSQGAAGLPAGGSSVGTPAFGVTAELPAGGVPAGAPAFAASEIDPLSNLITTSGVPAGAPGLAASERGAGATVGMACGGAEGEATTAGDMGRVVGCSCARAKGACQHNPASRPVVAHFRDNRKPWNMASLRVEGASDAGASLLARLCGACRGIISDIGTAGGEEKEKSGCSGKRSRRHPPYSRYSRPRPAVDRGRTHPP
jgi:hypothetical protein